MNKKQAINVYDFDHTIYRGDASLDFILFCMRKHPKLWKFLPSQALALTSYILRGTTRKKVKEAAFAFLSELPSINDSLDKFWSEHEKKINKWYLDRHCNSDLIISASPEFLLKPIAAKLRVGGLIATRMNEKTGKISGENCRGEEKVRRLEAYDKNIIIDHCYSDSLSDRFMLELAKTPYIVNKHALILLSEYTQPKLHRFKDPAFIRFLFVGGVNAFLGVLFAYTVSLFIVNSQLAWVIGYAFSLVVSYPLNAYITFKHASLSLSQFYSFCVSYIPNFAVQFISVFILIGYFGLYKLAAYILAVIIAVPITFLLLAKFTFNRGITE